MSIGALDFTWVDFIFSVTMGRRLSHLSELSQPSLDVGRRDCNMIEHGELHLFDVSE